jgi:hypothetical protein
MWQDEKVKTFFDNKALEHLRNTNMTNLQQEILREFEKKFSMAFNLGTVADNITRQDIKQFILSALQRQMEEVKKCVPEEKFYQIAPTSIKKHLLVEYANGFNDCRSQLLTNLEKI